MRTDFIQQRDPADENDYWYKKMGYRSFWAWVITETSAITIKSDSFENKRNNSRF